ncbi:MAG: indole-3-glycerol phosphate synthase TrpC [Bacteroidota bacterium]|nr:indole-3-glycerol phosphate synthase TrpC [Bacteroidota bacterium]
MNILEEIVAHKKEEVRLRKNQIPQSEVEKSGYCARIPLSLKASLQAEGSTGIIAEFKRQSPSKGIIHPSADVEPIARAYSQAGVAGMSVLTDLHFFGGENGDLIKARKVCSCPILRKEFIIDEYQIFEAKAIGADVILLIASILDKKQIEDFAKLAKSLGLEVLFEVHSNEELDKLNNYMDMIGINNRNLANFIVDIENSMRLAENVPEGFLKVAESGIHSAQTLVELKKRGFSGFLMGEHFMKQPDPGQACREFIAQVKQLL